ncbi:MAG TPA: fimbrillin family protein [Candidatus Bacteroides pullicola]|uniref:Fimbrillin family protein n=1 Tax=Candidatus Bacteroides pullicola TaxID=2838475 RepID=A0A9D1ZN17_9BACE|nr:fimbrillin family protein [Candidatus Bacteroides pullicola]
MEKMKNNLFIMAGAMIAALSLGACSNEDDTHGVDLSKPISLSFQPAAVVTKATVGVDNASFEAGDEIGVYVSSSALASAEYCNVKFTSAGGSWTATDMFWPSGKDTYDITAYYPFAGTENTAAATLAVSVPDNQSGDGYSNADYLWTKKATVQPTNANIPLTLDHKMSLLKLNMAEGNGISLAEVAAMTPAILGEVPAKGTWDLATGSITPDTEGEKHSSIRPYMDYDSGTGTLTYYALVMPGTTYAQNQRFLTLTGTDGTVFYYELNIEGGITAGAGTYVDLNLTVNRTGISLSSFTVGDWKPSDVSGSGTVTME